MVKIIRVACYVRVSTAEQKKHGYSVEAQIDRLKSYVDEHVEYMLIDFYVDNGVSAVKLNKRLELQRLLNDVRNNKIDLILFTKLDRWGRSVNIYHKIQDVLEEHDVIWRAIDEEYETQTASGKFKVNIMMSVAQQERDRCSERIKDVFEYKVKNGQAIYGSHSAPIGFKIDNKKMVHDTDKEEMVKDMINHYLTFQSKRKTQSYIIDKYNYNIDYTALSRLLKNPLLYGSYRDNSNYCEPYMTKEQWEYMQDILKKNIRKSNNDRTFIFARLIVCPCCHKKLIGHTSITYCKGKEYRYPMYRCDGYFTKHTCDFKKLKSQNKLEKQLLEKLDSFMNDYIVDCEMKEPKKKSNRSEETIRKEMDRLNNIYIKGRINDIEYDEKYNKLEIELKEATAVKKEVSKSVLDLKGINLKDLYNTFTDEEKQVFWRGLLKEIIIDEKYNILGVSFC